MIMNIASVNASLNTATPNKANFAPVGSSTPSAQAAQQANNMAQGVMTEQLNAAQKAETKPEELEAAVSEMNDFVKQFNNSLQFNLDKDSGKTIVKVIDMESKDVIRQIPSEEMVMIAKAIDKMKGLLVQQKA